MKKLLKITLFLILFGFLIVPSVYAVNPTFVDLNLESNTSSQNTSVNEVSDTNSNVPKVTKITSEDDGLLTTDNIISIILGVIGIVLILLAIAILIRLK